MSVRYRFLLAALALGIQTSATTVRTSLPKITLLGGSMADDAPAFTDNDHDSIDDTLEQRLANTFAPVIIIEPDESNYPVNVEWFLQRARLQYHEDCTSDVDEDIGPNPLNAQANLIGAPWTHGASFGADHPDAHCGEDDTGYSHPPHRRMTTIAADPVGQVSDGALTTGYSDQQMFVIPDLDDSYHVGSLNPLEWKTYFHAYPTRDGGIMLQYWHVFAYNALAIAGFGNHGGDWDATIHVMLGPDLKVEQVWFSRHSEDHPGTPFQPSRVTFINGTHPLMIIDGGGHAAYASPADFCGHGSPAGGTVSWPSDMNDPLSPAKLEVVGCTVEGAFLSDSEPGGTVWQTWDGGIVTATYNLTHQLPLISGHGGMVNLGEYNPCTPANCNGSRQASALLAGDFHPLNDQVFVRYEGLWGSVSDFATPPRGPVFQGADDTGNEVIYTSWYNQGSDTPADPAGTNPAFPWRELPKTTRTLTGPVYTANGVTYVAGTTTINLSVTQNAIADGFGSAREFYEVFGPGTDSAGFLGYSSPFALPAPDGAYEVEYYGFDALDNQEVIQAWPLTRDGTPPATTITQPAATSYVHSATITLNYTVTDGLGSGVASVTPTMDGATTLAGHGLASGQTVNLLIELSLGTHVFQVTAKDHVDNAAAPSVTFTIIVTPESIKVDVKQFFASGDVTLDEGRSLLRLLDAAAAARAKGQCAQAATIYQAFIAELQAQSGKNISVQAAAIMTADAQYLINHCP
jgi:hypothetical protein